MLDIVVWSKIDKRIRDPGPEVGVFEFTEDRAKLMNAFVDTIVCAGGLNSPTKGDAPFTRVS